MGILKESATSVALEIASGSRPYTSEPPENFDYRRKFGIARGKDPSPSDDQWLLAASQGFYGALNSVFSSWALVQIRAEQAARKAAQGTI